MKTLHVLVTRARACLFAVPAFLLGCSVGPHYHRPAAPVPTAWHVSPADSQPEWPAAEWWRAFSSSQLNDYIIRAQHSNDDLAAAMARVLEADAQVRIAGAALLPDVSAEANATRERALPAGGTRTAVFNAFSPQLVASYQLDFWGKNRETRNAALFAAQASRFDRETVALTVESSVALTYFQALELHDRLVVAQNNLANAQQTLSALELEQNVGVINALDVAQQATTVATLNAAIPPLAQQMQQTVDALAILLGQPPEDIHIEDATLDDLQMPPVQAGLPSQLLARRPDIAESEAQLRSANANIGAARAAFFPSVNLTASGGVASSVLSTLLTPESRVFALTASAAQTIFDNGTLRGQYQYSKARYTELLADYHKTVLSALGNVEDSLSAVQQTAEQEVRQLDAVSKAQRAFDYSQTQMRAGTINILIVLNTETALFTAQDALVQVKFEHMQALINLYESLGGGWHDEQVTS